jgi:hypothetical protein
MEYGASMKKKMTMGGRMGSSEMMESMKKDDKMLQRGGGVSRKNRKEREKSRKMAIKASAKGRKISEKEAKKTLRKSKSLRGLSKEQKQKLIKMTALKDRDKKREFMADEKRLRQEKFQSAMDARRKKAFPGEGKKKILSDSKKETNKAKKIIENNERIRRNLEAEKKAAGGFYEKIAKDGTIKTVISKMKGESDEAFDARRKREREKLSKQKTARHGTLIMVVAPVKKSKKKAMIGAKMKNMKARYGGKMENGGKVNGRKKLFSPAIKKGLKESSAEAFQEIAGKKMMRTKGKRMVKESLAETRQEIMERMRKEAIKRMKDKRNKEAQLASKIGRIEMQRKRMR